MTQSENQTTADRGAGIEILSTPAELDLSPAMAWSSRAAGPIRLMRNPGRSTWSASRQIRSLGFVHADRHFLSWLLPAEGDVWMSGLAGCLRRELILVRRMSGPLTK